MGVVSKNAMGVRRMQDSKALCSFLEAMTIRIQYSTLLEIRQITEKSKSKSNLFTEVRIM
jgi:hypothetical protein